MCAIGLAVLLNGVNLFLGNLNQDEGWYLYAAKKVAAGDLLYRDFMFTQGPALPYVYGLLFPVVEQFGLAGGRAITSLFGLAAAGCAAWLAARSVSRPWKAVALCAFILTGLNVYQSYFTTIVKTYSLCAFFLTAGFVALSYTQGRRGMIAAVLSGILLALAACTRLSAGVVLPVVGLWLIWNRAKVVRLAWVMFGIGGGLTLLVGLVSFFWVAPENTQFALFGYHAGRSPGGLTQLIALKVGFVSRCVQAYFVLTAGILIAFFTRRFHQNVRELGFDEMALDSRPRLIEMFRQANEERTPFSISFISLLWLAGILITIVHFTAPFPYDDYQVIVYPVFAAALSATLIPRCPKKVLLRVIVLLMLICTAASFSSTINQEWMIRGRDRIWWKFKEVPDLLALQRVGAQLREKMAGNALLLTQDTYLAVEARADVPHGMEMGPFCYYPAMSREQAEKLNLLNEESLIDTIRTTQASVAAFSGYGLTIGSPEVNELSSEAREALRNAVGVRYQKTGEVPLFGQAHTTLEIFDLK